MKAKYVNLFTDFGFKKIFGEEASKPLLIDFLTNLLPEIEIIDLSFKDKEQLGKSDNYRKAVYDIYCQNKNGEQIIVELQKAKQKYFKDRTMYYASFPIQELGEKGDWDYNLKAVFCVGILDFEFDEENQGLEEVIHTVQLKNQHNQIFYDKLKFVYLEMPHFNKSEKELETRLDKWLYFIRHLEDFQTIPEIFKDEVFEKAFKKAELANYTKQERAEYEESLKTYRDLKGVIDTAFDEGKLEGKLEGIKEGELKGKLEGIKEGELKGKIEIAKALKVNGISIEMIVKTTGLSEQEVNATTPTPASFSYSPNLRSFVSGSTAASSVAPTYINGTAGTYSIASGGTTGITIDATTGVLSWKGNIAVGTYTMSVTNAAGGNAPFTLTVTPAPSFSYSPNSVSFISDDVAKGSSITPIYTNGTAGAYSIASGGTTGITIDAATGVLSWSGRILPATYAINVTNAAGGSSTFSLTVTLAANYAAINGKIYKTVTIGTQTWMAENLNDAAHDNGISSCYDNEDEKCKQYGRLYNWAAANDIDSKIPVGIYRVMLNGQLWSQGLVVIKLQEES
ncbi:hypothetical protein CHS0354_024121 [Potamilus streckersoni]|uniref:PD-(D/E)XK nuclease family transposase n=1 Tax=Potamilus streckersoni TaxID=2493646 RepID=A0AAE0RZK7_9BIVA|nr:hypothetical protein CHS0354_024121 [Potamilus streckersoni]